jgi:hypothetical protein
MLAPPEYTRRVDVACELVAQRMSEGWRVDLFPDNRDVYYRDWIGHAVGRPAVVVANGPSAGHIDPAALAGYIGASGAVVITCNAAWRLRCLTGLDRVQLVSPPLLVILDDHFLDQYRAEVLAFLEFTKPAARLALCFDPSTGPPLDYMRLPLDIALHSHTRPEYNPARLFHGESSGCAGLQLALHSGADPIYLIGHDCTVIGGHTHSWGVRSSSELLDGYPQGRAMLAGYALAAEHARALGRRVFMLSDQSAIKDFPVCDPADVFDTIPVMRKQSPAGNKHSMRSTGAGSTPAPNRRHRIIFNFPVAREVQPSVQPVSPTPVTSESGRARNRRRKDHAKAHTKAHADTDTGPVVDFNDSVAQSGYESAYVRMVRTDGSGLVPVVVELVASKLIEGYAFAEGEPCLPRLTGDPYHSEYPCPTGRRWVARPGTPRVRVKREALVYWLGEAIKDKREFAGDNSLDHNIDHRLRAEIVRLDRIMGVPIHGTMSSVDVDVDVAGLRASGLAGIGIPEVPPHAASRGSRGAEVMTSGGSI